MSARCFTLSLAALAMLFSASAQGALINASGVPRPSDDWFLAVVDYWNPGGSAPVVDWRAYDAAYSLGDPSQTILELTPQRVANDFDRVILWLRYDQPTVYLEALSGPQLGVALHDFAVEAASLPDQVTVVPDDVAGGFWYSMANGSRHVTLDVLPIPEPSAALLAMCGLFAMRIRHSISSGT